MRIALVSPYSWTYPGGVNRHVESLTHQLLTRIAPGRSNEPVGALAGLRAGAAVQPGGQAVVRVEGREDAHVVALDAELGGQGLDVAGDAPGVRPRIRRHQGDAHRA